MSKFVAYWTGRKTAPTSYWTDELPTWLAPIVVLLRAALAIVALPLVLLVAYELLR